MTAAEFGTGFLAKLAPETVSVPYVLTIPMTFAAKENAEAVAAIRAWCDQTQASITDWLEHHNPECECEVGETYLACVSQVRALLPEVTS